MQRSGFWADLPSNLCVLDSATVKVSSKVGPIRKTHLGGGLSECSKKVNFYRQLLKSFNCQNLQTDQIHMHFKDSFSIANTTYMEKKAFIKHLNIFCSFKNLCMCLVLLLDLTRS